jgi:hypothetical protein
MCDILDGVTATTDMYTGNTYSLKSTTDYLWIIVGCIPTLTDTSVMSKTSVIIFYMKNGLQIFFDASHLHNMVKTMVYIFFFETIFPQKSVFFNCLSPLPIYN